MAIGCTEERSSANCCVVDRKAVSGRVIIGERRGTDGGIEKGINVIKECPLANCRVPARKAVSGLVIKKKRFRTDGGVCSAINVELERLKADPGVVRAADVVK